MSISSNGNGNSSVNTNPILTYYTEWSSRTAYITKGAMIAMVISWILSFFFRTDMAFANIPYFTLKHFEVYRIILAPFVGNSFLTVVLTALFFPQMGNKMESSSGSAGFLFLIGFISIITNIVFCAMCLLTSVLGSVEALFWRCEGFWTILFGLITIECMATPNIPRRLMFIPIDIPSQYFPLAMYCFFSLFSGFELSFAISMAVGYYISKGYLDKYRPSSYYFESLESSSGMLHSLSRNRGWVLAGASLGHDAWVPLNLGAIDRDGVWASGQASGSGASSSTAPPSGSTSGFSSFGKFGSSSPATTGMSTGGKDEKKEAFPGTGHSLSSSGVTLGTLLQPSSASAAVSREDLAKKRLAALGSTNSAAVVTPSAPPLGPVSDSSTELNKLLEMGFERQAAQRGLNDTDGTAEGALQVLGAFWEGQQGHGQSR